MARNPSGSKTAAAPKMTVLFRGLLNKRARSARSRWIDAREAPVRAERMLGGSRKQPLGQKENQPLRPARGAAYRARHGWLPTRTAR
jgi:hypothetical protein